MVSPNQIVTIHWSQACLCVSVKRDTADVTHITAENHHTHKHEKMAHEQMRSRKRWMSLASAADDDDDALVFLAHLLRDAFPFVMRVCTLQCAEHCAFPRKWNVVVLSVAIWWWCLVWYTTESVTAHSNVSRSDANAEWLLLVDSLVCAHRFGRSHTMISDLIAA